MATLGFIVEKKECSGMCMRLSSYFPPYINTILFFEKDTTYSYQFPDTVLLLYYILYKFFVCIAIFDHGIYGVSRVRSRGNRIHSRIL